MKESLHVKLKNIAYRYVELGGLMSDPMIINDQNRFRECGREYAQIEPIVTCFKAYQGVVESIENSQAMLQEPDKEIKALAQDELDALLPQKLELEEQLQLLLLPKDPNDECNVFLEVRAGTGGREAALFAGDLFRMYSRYAEGQRWRVTLISAHEGEQGGFKEVIARVEGAGVYSKLKFESGAHRVQRIPTTESQGRIHTSACTVAIMPEVEAIDSVDINMNDVRVDTFRASGAGGQHVNKTDSAIRLTHLPSGLVVECQDERSQHKNKAQALSLLQARLLDQQQSQQKQEQAEKRKSLVGSGDRSQRIRTYNFPQGRVTDHRINLTLYQLDDIIEGDLNPVIDPLIRELQAEMLAELGKD